MTNSIRFLSETVKLLDDLRWERNSFLVSPTLPTIFSSLTYMVERLQMQTYIFGATRTTNSPYVVIIYRRAIQMWPNAFP